MNARSNKNYWQRILNNLSHLIKKFDRRPLGLPSYTVEQIIDCEELHPVSLVDYQYIYGEMPLNELLVLCQIVRHRRPKTIFEIGTYLGGTTLQLAANSQAEIFTIDLPPPKHKDYLEPKIWDPASDVYPDNPGVRFCGSPFEQRIVQFLGNSQTFDFSPYYGGVDLVFVDGCHHYEFVRKDSDNAIKMLSEDGIVIWHDYARHAPGVVKALNELSNNVSLKYITGTSLAISQPKR
jgi:hypothetical protein